MFIWAVRIAVAPLVCVGVHALYIRPLRLHPLEKGVPPPPNLCHLLRNQTAQVGIASTDVGGRYCPKIVEVDEHVPEGLFVPAGQVVEAAFDEVVIVHELLHVVEGVAGG